MNASGVRIPYLAHHFIFASSMSGTLPKPRREPKKPPKTYTITTSRTLRPEEGYPSPARTVDQASACQQSRNRARTIFVEHPHRLHRTELGTLAALREEPPQEAHLADGVRVGALAELGVHVLPDGDGVDGAPGDVDLPVVCGDCVLHTIECEVDGAGPHAEVLGRHWVEVSAAQGARKATYADANAPAR
jgi:hypothetical protein